jgi:hypothetical protein
LFFCHFRKNYQETRFQKAPPQYKDRQKAILTYFYHNHCFSYFLKKEQKARKKFTYFPNLPPLRIVAGLCQNLIQHR